jgi:hypothetical protein
LPAEAIGHPVPPVATKAASLGVTTLGEDAWLKLAVLGKVTA